MLVLSRKPNEKIVLTDRHTGQEVTVLVVSMKNGQVRLGIDAPDSIDIIRSELREKEEAAHERCLRLVSA